MKNQNSFLCMFQTPESIHFPFMKHGKWSFSVFHNTESDLTAKTGDYFKKLEKLNIYIENRSWMINTSFGL